MSAGSRRIDRPLQRGTGRFVLGLVLCGAALAQAPPASAQAPPATPVIVRFKDFLPPNLLRVWEDAPEGARTQTYMVSAAGAAQLDGWVRAGILPKGSYLELSVEGSGNRVVVARLARLGADEVAQPFALPDERRPVPTATETASTGAVRGWTRGLLGGDWVRVNGRVYVFERLLPGDLLELSREGESSSLAMPLAQVQTFEKLARPPRGAQGSRGRPEIVPGDPVAVRMPGGRSLKGVLLVYDLAEKTLVLQVLPGGREETLQLGPGLRIRKIDPSELEEERPTPRHTVTTTPRSVKPKSKIVVVHGDPKLDTVKNVYTIDGSVHHREKGRVLLRASLVVSVHSRPLVNNFRRLQGRLLSPEREKAVLDRYGGAIPDDEATDLESPIYPIRQDDGGLVVVRPESIPDKREVDLGTVFPDRPREFSMTTDLLHPRFEIELAYEEADLVAFTDQRAARFFISAYDRARSAEERARILSAVAANKAPAFIPFLFDAHYRNAGSRKALEQVCRVFGEAAERWLLDLVKTRGWRNGLDIETADDRKKRVYKNDGSAFASALRLLGALGSDPALEVALTTLRTRPAPTAEVAAAARAVFLERPSPPIGFLLQRLTAESHAVRELLLDLDARRPGILAQQYRDYGIEDPRFEEELVTLKAEETAERYVQRLTRYLDEDPTRRLTKGIVDALAAKARLQDSLPALAKTRREAASRLAAPDQVPPAEAHPRHWRTEQLRKALLMNRANKAARVALAKLLREIAIEIRAGARVRPGPGEAWRPLGAVKPGEVFVVPEKATHRGAWLAVTAYGGAAFVSTTCVRRGVRRAVAVSSQRPPGEVLSLLRSAEELAAGEVEGLDEDLVRALITLANTHARADAWPEALPLYAEAYARHASRDTAFSLGVAYLHVHAWLPATIVGLVFVLLLSVLARQASRV